MIIFYIPIPSKEAGQSLGHGLLAKKFVGCCNIMPVNSMFWWKGEISCEDEFVIICKTIESKSWEVEKYVKENHPYDTPCIIRVNAEANKKFLTWLNESL